MQRQFVPQLVAMLTMSGIAAPVAVLMGDRVNVLAGLFTLYLLVTGWATVRRKAGGIGRFEVGAFVAALGLSAAALTLGLLAMNSPTGTLEGAPAPAFFIFGTIAPLAAAFDLKVILRRGISGTQRIARHLWRMCFALFVASGSLFLGQQQVFPDSVRGTPILFVLALAPLAMLLFWLLWVRFMDTLKRDATASAGAYGALPNPPICVRSRFTEIERPCLISRIRRSRAMRVAGIAHAPDSLSLPVSEGRGDDHRGLTWTSRVGHGLE